MSNIVLWHAGPPGQSNFGTGTSWAESRSHAEGYTRSASFGGPALYRASIRVTPGELLDLREADPWHRLREEFDLDREDYQGGEMEQDLFRELAPVFRSAGYQWVAFYEGHQVGDHTSRSLYQVSAEWLYLGDVPIPVEAV